MSVLSVLLIFLSGCVHGAAPPKLPCLIARYGRWSGDARIPSDLKLPALNSEKLYVYKIVRKPATEGDVRRSAARFGVHGPVEHGSGYFEVSDERKWVAVAQDDASYVIYRDHALRLPFEETQTLTREDFPDYDSCLNIAVDFLRDHGILPPAESYCLEGFADNINSGGEITVFLTRMVDGYASTRTGNLIVGVTRDGQVNYCRRWMPRIDRYGCYPVLSPEEALSAFAAGKRFGFDPHSGGAAGDVAEVRLMYVADYVDDWLVRPFYLFSGGHWGSEDAFSVNVDAIRDEYLGGPGTLQPDEAEKSPEEE